MWPGSSSPKAVLMRRLLLVVAALATAGILASALPAARGDLDPSFGSGGKVTTDFGGNEIGWAVAVQRDGKAIVAGDRFDPGPADDFVLARYAANGRLDPSFDRDGEVTTDFNDHFSGAFGVAIQPDGKIVAAGYGFSPTGPQDFALARYNQDGSLDQSFGAGGKVLTTFVPNSIDGGGALAIQPDGKILVGGRTRSGVTSDFGLVRYLSNGALDASFDGDGRVVTAISASNDQIFDLAVQPDGKIVAAGWMLGTDRADIAIARYDPDGALDSTFEGDGKVVAPFPMSSTAYSVILQRDGKILTGGSDVARFNADGTVDRSFGAGGRASTGAVTGLSLQLQPDGKILAVGSVFPGQAQGDFAVVRLTAAGRVDTTYGRGGRIVTDFGPLDQANDAALLPNGKLVVSGFTRQVADSGPADFAVARYQAIRFCVVPNARAKALAAARSAVTRALCSVGTVKRTYSAKVGKGRVISQRPAPRTRLAELAKVNLVVSRGRRRET
jgi:uncharacterized delta-60 repeat protein